VPGGVTELHDVRAGSGSVGVASTFTVLVELLVEMKPLEDELDGGGHQARALEGAEQRHPLAQTGNLTDPLQVLLGAHLVGDLDAPPRLEVLDHPPQGLDLQVLVPHLEDGPADEALDLLVFLLVLTRVLELDLSRSLCRAV